MQPFNQKMNLSRGDYDARKYRNGPINKILDSNETINRKNGKKPRKRESSN